MLHTYWIGNWTNVWSAKAEQFSHAIPWTNIYTDNNCGIRAFIANDWHFRLQPYSLYRNSHLGGEIGERYSERKSWTEDISAEETNKLLFLQKKQTKRTVFHSNSKHLHICAPTEHSLGLSPIYHSLIPLCSLSLSPGLRTPRRSVVPGLFTSEGHSVIHEHGWKKHNADLIIMFSGSFCETLFMSV